MSVIPQTPRASPLWAPYQGSALDPLGTLSSPQILRLLTAPLTTNPGSTPENKLIQQINHVGNKVTLGNKKRGGLLTEI